MTPNDFVFPSQPDKAQVEYGSIFMPKFDVNGLVAAIVIDAGNGIVLMFAWMNAEALKLTLATGTVHFWSRSRGKLWLKGEESGNFLLLKDISVDCDQDTLVIRATVAGDGVACHTGARSCFYRTVGAVPEADGTFRLYGPGNLPLQPIP